MAKVESVWYYEASIKAKETIEDKTVEKATQKAHLQSKPSEKAKVEASDLTFKKRTIKLEEKYDDRTEKDKGSGSQKTKGSGQNVES